MLWIALALVLELTPTQIPQGQVVRIKAPGTAASVRWNNRTLPLFPANDGTKAGLVPIPALEPTGPKTFTLLDASGNSMATATLDVLDALFRKQNVTLGRAVQGLQPAPGEMEMVAALRKSVTPVRHWTEPLNVPTAGCLTSPFGVQRLHNGKPTGNYHGGLDQRGAEGVPIQAVADGIVKIVRKFNIHGDTVGIDHGQGVTSIYLHMSKFATTEDATVRKGDVIGYIGTTGRSTAPHLHWALNVHGTPVNPMQWLTIEPCASNKPAKKAQPKRPRTRR